MMTTMCRGNSQGDKRWQQVSNATERVKVLCVQNICRHVIEIKWWGGIWKQKCHWRNWTGGIWKFHFSVTWWMMQFTSNHCCFVSSILVYISGAHEVHIQADTKQWLPCTSGPTAFPAQSNSHFWQGEYHRSQWTCTASWPLIIFIIFIHTSFSKLNHHKSHSVCLHCLFHCKWAWDEVFRHMDQGNRDCRCGTVSCKHKIKLFSHLGSHRELGQRMMDIWCWRAAGSISLNIDIILEECPPSFGQRI